MRILLTQYLVYLPALGGASRVNREMLEFLARRGHECIAIAPAFCPQGPRTREEFCNEARARHVEIIGESEESEIFRLNGVEVHALIDSRRMAAYMRNLCLTNPVDCILVGADDPAQATLECALSLSGVRVAFIAQATMYLPFGPMARIPSAQKARDVSRADAIICNSSYVADYFRKHLPAAADFPPPEIVAMPVAVMGLESEVPPRRGEGEFVTLVNPCAIKGIAIFLELARRFPETAFAAVPTWGTTQADLDSLKALPNIRILPADENIEVILAQTRILLAPSLWDEAYGRIVVEAMLRGIPVLASNVGGLPEAKLGVDYLLPVAPIEAYEAAFDEFNQFIPRVPRQKIDPWVDALREILANEDRYRLLARESREAAARLVDHADFEEVERFLSNLQSRRKEMVTPAARESTRLAVVERLSPSERTALALKALQSRKKKEPEAKTCKTSAPSRFPASFEQARLVYLQLADPEGASYHVGQVIELRGPLNREALQKALDALVARHEPLRANFIVGESVEQIIAEPRAALLEWLSAEGLNEAARVEQTTEMVRREMARPFDLGRDLMIRAVILRAAPLQHLLVVTVHHLAIDGRSLEILLGELGSLYSAYSLGEALELPPVRSRYSEFVEWQRSPSVAALTESDTRYWTDKFRGITSTIRLPIDRGEMKRKDAAPPAARELLKLPPEFAASVREFARGEGATSFMLYLAAFQLLLHRYCGGETAMLATPVSWRGEKRFEDTFGCFANLMLLSSDITNPASFREYLAATKNQVIEGVQHSHHRYDQLLTNLREQGGFSGGMPEILFAFTNHPLKAATCGGVNFNPIHTSTPAAKADLMLFVADGAEGSFCAIEYRTDLFARSTIRRWLEHYQRLIKAVLANPEADVRGVEFLGQAERERILREWNATSASYPAERTLSALFREQAETRPNRVALVYRDRKLTYEQFHLAFSGLAGHLRQLGVKRGTIVAVCLERSIEMVVTIAAILKAGAAYLPLDIEYPKERLAGMLSDSGAKIVLTQREWLHSLEGLAEQVIPIEELAMQGGQIEDETTPDDLAYVIYTSGSTGRPKGVKIQHRGVVNLVSAMRSRTGLAPEDTFVAVSTLCFDISVLELWLPLSFGATVVIAESGVSHDPFLLAKLLEAERATVLMATPSRWRMLLQTGWTGKSDLKAFCGGEKMPRDLADHLLAGCREVWNMYGPTETSVCATIHQVAESDAPVSIGKPLANVQVLVLDSRQRLAPIGIPGEIHIGGAGVGPGYCDSPELTRERFIPNPFPEIQSPRLYKTGDLGRFLESGDIEMLGRMDRQVKVRGFRIELAEIERVLRKHPGVAEAVAVAADPLGNGSAELAAYFVLKNGPISTRELREFIKGRLPGYMTPTHLAQIPAIPLTATGKVDFAKLPRLSAATVEKPPTLALPATPLELKIAEIWQMLLKKKEIGLDESFFDVGGHSLLAVTLLARMRQAFEREFSLAQFLARPTISGLRQTIEAGTQREPVRCLIPLRAHGSRPPLFLLHAHSGQPLNYMPLVRRLSSAWPVYGFQSRALDAGEEDDSVATIASRYVRELRGLQPSGPYYIAGLCLGGFLAYEMANQLVRAGERVAFLGLLEAQAPRFRQHRNLRNAVNRSLLNVATRAHYEYNIVFRLAPEERSRRFRDRFNRLADFVELRVRRNGNSQRWRAAAQKAHLLERYLRAVRAYEPPAYPGPVNIFVSQTRAYGASKDPTLGWKEYVSGRMTVQTVPGQFTTMIAEPNVRTLAGQMEERLEHAFKGQAIAEASLLA